MDEDDFLIYRLLRRETIDTGNMDANDAYCSPQVLVLF